MITVQWHLIVYIVVMVMLLVSLFKDRESFDFTPFIIIAAMLILTAIYGGIFWW